MRRKRILGLIVLAALLPACAGVAPTAMAAPTATPAPSPTPGPTIDWQGMVEEMSGLQRGLEIPEQFLMFPDEPVKTGAEFDVSVYFDVLDHLSMKPGYALDWVYFAEFIGAEPVLYVRSTNQEPYQTYSQYVIAGGTPFGFGEERYEYLDYVQVDGTVEGFFQFIILRILGGQFYLYWHAGYNDTRIVCDRETLDKILNRISIGDARTRMARQIDPTPVVAIGDDEVTVRMVVFSDWGGFTQLSYRISRDYPHEILDVESDVLMPYDCGILF